MNFLIKNKRWKINKDYNKEKLLYLLIDKPTEINNNINCFVWKNNENQIHRDYDLPACIWNNGNIFWLKNNLIIKQQ